MQTNSKKFVWLSIFQLLSVIRARILWCGFLFLPGCTNQNLWPWVRLVQSWHLNWGRKAAKDYVLTRRFFFDQNNFLRIAENLLLSGWTNMVTFCSQKLKQPWFALFSIFESSLVGVLGRKKKKNRFCLRNGTVDKLQRTRNTSTPLAAKRSAFLGTLIRNLLLSCHSDLISLWSEEKAQLQANDLILNLDLVRLVLLKLLKSLGDWSHFCNRQRLEFWWAIHSSLFDK